MRTAHRMPVASEEKCAICEKSYIEIVETTIHTLTIQTKTSYFGVITVLQSNGKGGQKRRPRHLEHWPHMLEVLGRGEWRLHVRHRLHQVLGRTRHRLHFHVPQQLSLLFVGNDLLARFVHCGILHFDLLAGNLVVNLRQIFFGQVFAVADAAIQIDVLFFSHFILDLRRMQIGRQHDHGKGEHVHRIGAGK